GFKYNLSDIQSAIGIHQLRKLDRFTAERTAIAAAYDAGLSGIEEIETPPPSRHGKHAWHLYMLRLRLDKLSIDRAEFIRELKDRQIGTSVHFIPIQQHPFFVTWAGRNPCPQAKDLYSRLISLPLYPGLSEPEIERVIAAVKEIVLESRKQAPVYA